MRSVPLEPHLGGMEANFFNCQSLCSHRSLSGGAPQPQVLGRDAEESPLLLPGQVLAKSFRLGAQVYGEL